jgi:hypothetical protein
MYVVNWTQYGDEGQELYGPFAKKKDAEDVFDLVVGLHENVPPPRS